MVTPKIASQLACVTFSPSRRCRCVCAPLSRPDAAPEIASAISGGSTSANEPPGCACSRIACSDSFASSTWMPSSNAEASWIATTSVNRRGLAARVNPIAEPTSRRRARSDFGWRRPAWKYS